MRILKYLNYPYPFYETSMQAFKLSLYIGMFIGLFCFLFRPFGLDSLKSIELLGFGVVSFVVCFTYMVALPFFFPLHLSTAKWKVYKEIIWICCILLSISIADYYYLGFVYNEGYKFSWPIFLFVAKWTFIIGIIPAIAIILYKQVFVYKKIVKEVEKLDAKLIASKNIFLPREVNELAIKSDNLSEKFSIDVNDFIALSSAGNYVEVFYESEEKVIKKSILRNNISRVEREIERFDFLKRCHRSHIVNLKKIDRVKGNLQGYQLFFNGLETQIPVSRKYTKTIKESIMKD